LTNKLKTGFILFLLILFTSNLFAGNYDFTIKSLDQIKLQLDGKSKLEKILTLEQYIKNNNGFVELYILKAEIELGVQDYIGSRNTLLSALAVEPLNMQVMNLLGMTYFHLKEWDNARIWFEKVIKIEPDEQFATYYLSILDPFADRSQSGNKTDYSWKKIDVYKLDTEYSQLTAELDRDFVYLSYQREITAQDGNSYEYSVHNVIKILSQKGADFFRNFSFGYNSYEFYPEVVRAGSYDKTYSFNEIDYKNIIVVDPADMSDYSMYTNKKEVAFPFHDLSKGSIIEFRIQFHSTGRTLTKNWFDYHMFGSMVRTMQSNYIIHYPKNTALNFYESGTGFTVSDTEENSDWVTRTYSYTMPPRYDLDDESVTIMDVSPSVYIGTFISWDSIGSWYDQLFSEKLGQPTGDLPVIKQLDLADKTKTEQIQEIYHYIQRSIHYVGIELGESALVPHSPQEVITSRIGDCKDQAILLIYLLRSLGIEALPVLVPTSDHGPVIKQVPSPYYFNHLITWVPAQDGIENELFLDTTSTTTSFGNLPSSEQGVEVFVIKGDDSFFVKTPVIDASQNTIIENYRFLIDLIGKGTVEFEEIITGSYSEIIRYSFKSKSRDEVFDYLYNLQKKSYNSLEKKDFSVDGLDQKSGPLVFKLSTQEKDLTSIYFDGRQKLKFTINDIASFLQFPTDRKYDYRRDFLYNYRKKMEYVFPEGYEVTESNLRNFSKENEYLYFHFIPEQISDNRFTIEAEVRLKQRTIDKDELSKLNQFVTSITSNVNYELILENKNSFEYEKFYEALIAEYNQKEVYENYLKRLFDEKKYDTSLKVVNRAIKTFPEDHYFYMLKATLFVNQEEYSKAESAIIDGLTQNDTSINLHLYLIEIYKKQQNDQSLEQTLKDANKKFPGNMSLISEMTGFYNRLSRYDDAIVFMNENISLDPENSSLYGDLGYIYSLKQDFDNAEKSLKKSIEVDSKNSTALNNLAWLYCEFDRNIKEAITYSERACELEPFNDAFFDTLAEVYFKDGQYPKAIAAIEKAISINPNYTYLQQQLEKIEKAKKMQEQGNQ